jgi:hypothetical protein
METHAKDIRDLAASQGVTDAQRVVYAPREGITREEELAALAACYAFVIEAHQRRKNVAPTDEIARGGEASEAAAGPPSVDPIEEDENGRPTPA